MERSESAIDQGYLFAPFRGIQLPGSPTWILLAGVHSFRCCSFSMLTPWSISLPVTSVKSHPLWIYETFSEGSRGVQPVVHGAHAASMAVNVAQHKIIKLLKHYEGFFVIMCHNIFNV